MKLELTIARLLRGGVVLAGILLVIGWLGLFSWISNPFLLFRVYHPVPLLEQLPQLYHAGAWFGLSSYVGLLVLISLPLLRLLLASYLFLRNKENYLAGIAWLVLLLILFSFTLGLDIL